MVTETLGWGIGYPTRIDFLLVFFALGAEQFRIFSSQYPKKF